MEDQLITPEIATELIPEIDDILDFNPTGQEVLVLAHEPDKVKMTQSGIIIDAGISSQAIKNSLLQCGVVVSVGKRCDEITADMIVYYYNSAISNGGGMIRQGQTIYRIMNEYDIKGFIKPVKHETI